MSRLRLGGVVLTCTLLATACGTFTSSDDGPPKTVGIALNRWVGYEADAAVVQYLLENELNYKVILVQIDEQPAWGQLDQGTLDAILENWGHEDLEKAYIQDSKTAVDGGATGNEGVIGWYLPKYLADEYPGITDWRNLNKYSHLFRTDRSGKKGEFLASSPSYVTNDKAVISNLKLNYQVVFAGTEDAEIAQVRQRYAKRLPVLFYFYQPQWLFSQLDLVKVNLPKYTKGCDANPLKVACDYPTYNLNKIFSKKFADSGSPAYQFLKNFHWTNKDQNEVAALLADKHMNRAQAARTWVNKHRDAWHAWMPK
jgi:glycine betaine/proline transport system substrate-binding protein